MTSDELIAIAYGRAPRQPLPEGVSTVRVGVGVGVTPLASLSLLKAGLPIPWVLYDRFAPIVPQG